MVTHTHTTTPQLDAAALSFLLEFADTPAPAGFEEPAADAWCAYARDYADAVRVDHVGNCFATLNSGGSPRVTITGHLDEIGLIVTKVDDKGFLRCTDIGGWDIAVLVGQRVRVLGQDGVVHGTISRPAVHVLEQAAREQVPKLRDLWIDIGAEHGDEARERVAIGDPLVIDVTPIQLGEHRLVSRSLDDRVGSFVALEALRELAGDRDGLAAEVVAVGSTREEIGADGALTATHHLQPDAAIAVDVTTPSDTPGGNDTGDLSLGNGPIITRGASTNAGLVERLIAVAIEGGIPHQLRGMGLRTRTDVDAISRAGSGVPAALLSVPARYLHSPCEQVDLRDVRATIDLLVAWVRTLGR